MTTLAATVIMPQRNQSREEVQKKVQTEASNMGIAAIVVALILIFIINSVVPRK